MLYDLSPMIHETMVVYKNNPEKAMVRTIVADYSTSQHYDSRIDFNMHTGSHVDAPLHMLRDGASIDEIPLERFYGRALVVDATSVVGELRPEHFAMDGWDQVDYVLFHTASSHASTFLFDFPYVGKALASVLAALPLKGVGIDALGIERAQEGHPTHALLLGAGKVILEGINLAKVPVGTYQLYAFPLRIQKAEASPVRAVLLQEPAV
ncbi:MAG: cyclase family protein [Erysipelotrichaceae bacterium]